MEILTRKDTEWLKKRPYLGGLGWKQLPLLNRRQKLN